MSCDTQKFGTVYWKRINTKEENWKKDWNLEEKRKKMDFYSESPERMISKPSKEAQARVFKGQGHHVDRWFLYIRGGNDTQFFLKKLTKGLKSFLFSYFIFPVIVASDNPQVLKGCVTSPTYVRRVQPASLTHRPRHVHVHCQFISS